jgi:hypothetical protein
VREWSRSRTARRSGAGREPLATGLRRAWNTVIGPGSSIVNMSLIKNVDLGRPRTLSIRVQATNVFNTPPLVGIDTVVDSPTFGQVIQVGPMRSLQLQLRFRS